MAVSAAARCAGPHGYHFPGGAQFGFNSFNSFTSCNTATLIADVSFGSTAGGVILAGLLSWRNTDCWCDNPHRGGHRALRNAIWLNVGGAVAILGMSCWGQ